MPRPAGSAACCDAASHRAPRQPGSTSRMLKRRRPFDVCVAESPGPPSHARSPPRSRRAVRGSVRARPDTRGRPTRSTAGRRAGRAPANARRLAQVVAQTRALHVLGHPAHQARPADEQGLVHDLDALGSFALSLRCFDPVRGQQAGVDQGVEHMRPRPPRSLRPPKTDSSSSRSTHRTRALRRHQVAEELAHDRYAVRCRCAPGSARRAGPGRHRPRR